MQHTLGNIISCSGIALHSGLSTQLTLKPGPVDSGIVFIRSDVTHADNVIPALWHNVVDTQLCTVIANAAGTKIATIEHVMAALRGYGIDNAIIEVSGPEVPIMDGSAEPFVFLLECVGRVSQNAPRKMIEVLKTIRADRDDGSDDAYAVLSPAPQASFEFEIQFNSPVIRRQRYNTVLHNTSTFKFELARARTFCFLDDIDRLRQMGLARGGSEANAIVVGQDRILNTGGLRYKDEFVRHKVLDAVGDVFLAGAPIIGHFYGSRAGHALNIAVTKKLMEDSSAWRYIVPAEHSATQKTSATEAA